MSITSDVNSTLYLDIFMGRIKTVYQRAFCLMAGPEERLDKPSYLETGEFIRFVPIFLDTIGLLLIAIV